MVFALPSTRLRMPQLGEDELFSTFLVRAAHGNGLEAWRFCNLVWPGVPIWTRDIDRSADPAWLADVAGRLEVSPDRLRAATFLDLEEALGGARPAFLPTVLAAGIYHRARRRHGLQYCPDCLAERPMVYRRTWRSALAVVCTRHDRALRDACPHCDQPLVPHRGRRLNRDLCGCCGRCLVHEPVGSGPRVPDRIAAAQSSLLPGVLDADPAAVEEACDLRALLGVLASNVPVDRLADALGVPLRRKVGKPRGIFERHRHAARIAALELATAWRAAWPESFRAGAEAMGLSARRFDSRRVGPVLAAEIARLPDPVRRRRGPRQPLVHTEEMRWLARRMPVAYRKARAMRLDRLSER